MKILIVSYAYLPSLGGTEVNAHLLACGFKRRGHHVRILTDTLSAEGSDDLEVWRRPSPITRYLLARWADVILYNNPSLRFLCACLLANRPHIVAVLTWIQRNDGKRSLVDVIKRWSLLLANQRIFISRAIAQHCQMSGALIFNPVRREFLNADEVDTWRQRPYDVLFVGRLVESKGVDLLLNAVAKLREAGLNPTVTVVGTGDKDQLYRQLVVQLGLKNVTFRGRQEANELVNTYRSHKVLVVPSSWSEPFGNVALEGMACGCFPIVSKGGGLPDAVAHFGLYFSNGNLDELVAQMAIALSPGFDRPSFGKGIEDHLKTFDEDTVVDRYLAELEAVRVSG